MAGAEAPQPGTEQGILVNKVGGVVIALGMETQGYEMKQLVPPMVIGGTVMHAPADRRTVYIIDGDPTIPGAEAVPSQLPLDTIRYIHRGERPDGIADATIMADLAHAAFTLAAAFGTTQNG